MSRDTKNWKLRHSTIDNEYAETQYTNKNVHFDMGSKKIIQKRGSG